MEIPNLVEELFIFILNFSLYKHTNNFKQKS